MARKQEDEIMKFNEKLNYYLNSLNCSSKELSEVSGISEAAISRYRKGDRTPREGSSQLMKLGNALYRIAEKKKPNAYTESGILKDLTDCVKNSNDFDYDNFCRNFSDIIGILKINVNDMAKYTVFDASHLSRIKNGKSKPSEPVEFCKKVSRYITDKYFGTPDLSKLCIFLNIEKEDGLTEAELFEAVFNYLIRNKQQIENPPQIAEFLKNLDEFNLNDYIKAIKFDELKVPNIPFYKVKNGNYYGLDGMKSGELNFFKATVLSKSSDDIFMCSDMPMEDMAEDIEFGKKWMFAIALCLKKGLHLNIIHNLDRPFNEMMLGLESWIPIYMTGQISPYYLKEVKNSVYSHLNYVSGKCALVGECIRGHHSDGKYYLTTNGVEIEYHRKKSDFLLQNAKPLMEIYDRKSENKFKAFQADDRNLKCDRKRILNTLPLFTMSDELLDKILKKNGISDGDAERIFNFKREQQQITNSILKENRITDTVSILSEKQFNDGNRLCLPLENLFFDKKVYYDFQDYTEHLKQTDNFNRKNYTLIKSDTKIFKNISITVAENSYVIVSKVSDPVIHFVIKHPKLMSAIEDFDPIVK